MHAAKIAELAKKIREAIFSRVEEDRCFHASSIEEVVSKELAAAFVYPATADLPAPATATEAMLMRPCPTAATFYGKSFYDMLTEASNARAALPDTSDWQWTAGVWPVEQPAWLGMLPLLAVGESITIANRVYSETPFHLLPDINEFRTVALGNSAHASITRIAAAKP